MTKPRLLLCTDMDRTIIPNGLAPEDAQARQQFTRLCQQSEVTLVYVTGRHQQLVTEAIHEYQLPAPDFAITDVGTKIYKTESRWQELETWEQEIAQDWRGKNHTAFKTMFTDLPALQLQETAKQNTHKLSYYVDLKTDHNKLLAEMALRLKQAGVQASLIWSVDELKQIGLLDVLPEHATKLHAIDFLRQQLGYALDEVVFAGDSGNDLPVLTSGIPSVLVANAAADVRLTAQKMASRNGTQASLYCATGQIAGMNGNYAAGVLEGVCHFIPAFCSMTIDPEN